MRIGELFVALGFDVDDKKLTTFTEDIKGARNDLLKLSAVTAGTLFAINKFISGSVQAATALRNFNEETGNSIEGLQKWQVASVLTNASTSADQVTASFKAMAQQIADVTLGRGNAGAFAMLGVPDVRGMDVAQVMEELRKNFDRNVTEWGYAQTVNLMQDVGVDPGMIRAIKLAREEFDNLTDGRFLSKETRDSLVQLGDRIRGITFDLQLFKDRLSGDISPVLIDAIDRGAPIVLEFAQNAKALAIALGDIWSVISPLEPILSGFATALFISFNPLLAVFAGLAIAVNDYGKALRGLPSISGNVYNFLEDITEKQIEFFQKQGLFPTAAVSPARAQGNFSTVPTGVTTPLGRQSVVDIVNTWNINGASDLEILADELGRRQREQLNAAIADQNKGTRY